MWNFFWRPSFYVRIVGRIPSEIFGSKRGSSREVPWHIAHFRPLQRSVNVCRLKNDLPKNRQSGTHPSSRLSCLLRDLTNHLVDLRRIGRQIALKLKIRVQKLLRVNDQSLATQGGFNPKITRHVADYPEMLRSCRLKESVKRFLRKITMDLDEIVSRFLLGDHFRSDLVRRHKSRLLDERPGRVDLRRDGLSPFYVVAQSDDFG
jgi:hypothetical protein